MRVMKVEIKRKSMVVGRKIVRRRRVSEQTCARGVAFLSRE